MRQASKINASIIYEMPWTIEGEKASRRDRDCIASIQYWDAAKSGVVAEFNVRRLNPCDFIGSNHGANAAMVMTERRRMPWF